jgi:hypothetical protein
MIELSVGVDDLGLGLEAVVAAGATHAVHVHDAGQKKKELDRGVNVMITNLDYFREIWRCSRKPTV